jgi:hypothetical protein
MDLVGAAAVAAALSLAQQPQMAAQEDFMEVEEDLAAIPLVAHLGKEAPVAQAL